MLSEYAVEFGVAAYILLLVGDVMWLKVRCREDKGQ